MKNYPFKVSQKIINYIIQQKQNESTKQKKNTNIFIPFLKIQCNKLQLCMYTYILPNKRTFSQSTNSYIQMYKFSDFYDHFTTLATQFYGKYNIYSFFKCFFILGEIFLFHHQKKKICLV